MTKRPHTINSFALCKIVIVCIGEKTVSISSYYSLDVSATIRFQISDFRRVNRRMLSIPAVYVEEEPFHGSGWLKAR